MGNLNFRIGISFCLLLLCICSCNCLDNRISKNYKGKIYHSRNDDFDKINDFISGLNYTRDQVLAYKGLSTPTTLPKREGKLDSSSNFIVITREYKSITNGKADIGILASNEHRTYPGSLLLANSRLVDNIPDLLVINRAPITYTVNLPGFTSEGSFSIVPTFSAYEETRNIILQKWFKRYAEQYGYNALFESEYSLAYNKDQLRVKFGTELFQMTGIESGINFDAILKKEISVMIYRFKQVFYTVSVESPKTPADLFGSGVTVSELSNKVNEENPPVLVDSVSYGRVIYVKIEAAYNEDFVSLLANFDFIKGEMGDTKGLKNMNMQVYVMGGAKEQVELIAAKSIQDVQNVIMKYGNFSKENLGYPISYSSEFIKDNSRAMIKGTAEYTETTAKVFEKGIIRLSHTGWYVAKWVVTWDEISYDQNGNEMVFRNGWYRNEKSVTAPFSTDIQLDGNCRNIQVVARECTGLIWEWWRTVFDRSGIPLIDDRKFSIWGTTLNQKYSIYPEI